MKFKKISAALTAITLAATMAAGMAMTASASPVVENGVVMGDGGFYAYYDADNDGTSEWAPAPHGMYDANIKGDVIYNSTTDTVSFELQSAKYTIQVGNQTYEVEGTVTAILNEDDENVIQDDVATMVVGEEYTLVVDGYHRNTVVEFRIS